MVRGGRWVGAAALGAAALLLGAGCDGEDVGGLDGSSGQPDARPASMDGGGEPDCASDADCDDGAFCNGPERCEPADPNAGPRGCAPASSGPCMAEQSCDEEADACVTECAVTEDADGDGHIARECGGDDCDDSDRGRFPGNPEVCDPDHVDEDCDPATIGGVDVDGDGLVATACCNERGDGVLVCGEDCDDHRRSVQPGSPEVCDGIDNDCDALVDEAVQASGFFDADGDLHGDPERPLTGCARGGSFSAVGDDCDDSDPAIHAAQQELCNGADDDCDGEVDEGAGAITWYRDQDGDGFGDPAGTTTESCTRPAGHSPLPTDCDDDDPMVHPGATERCNALDDDCNGQADHRVGAGDFEDDDLDGAADGACGGDDCDDLAPTVHPGAPELVDGVDNDCDGSVDGTCDMTDWWVDSDGDGYGDPASAPSRSCDPIEGRVTNGRDCEDGDPTIHPAALEECNAEDDDCDDRIDEAPERLCFAPHAITRCTPEGSCELRLCERDHADCDDELASGCEAELRTDTVNCGACGDLCFDGAMGLGVCADGECALECVTGYGDCDGDLGNGCESDLFESPAHCGRCDNVCSARDNAQPACDTGSCAIRCEPGWADCNGLLDDGCEVHVARDLAHCGGCDAPCTVAGDVCVRGSCTMPAFPSAGTMDFAPDADTVLTGGVHEFASIHIPPGVTVTMDGVGGRLELRASGPVVIEGTIDVSGGRGGRSSAAPNGGGGWAATPTAGQDGCETSCCPGGSGGDGAPGGSSSRYPDACGAGGDHGGGAGGADGGNAGGGGGGYAGGEGGDHGGTPGAGASVVGFGSGGSSGTGPGRGGEPDLVGTPLQVYAGADGRAVSGCGGTSLAHGGGGGSIGAAAAMDLAVTHPDTFIPGSGGGGGAGAGGDHHSGAGGGGGGGALLLSSATEIRIDGAVRANGGAGGSTTDGFAGPGGGGSGGVIYLAAPRLTVNGTVSAAGGSGGGRGGVCSGSGGGGGLGRVRVSVLPSECTLGGSWTPPLESSCALSEADGTPGYVYIGEYPD